MAKTLIAYCEEWGSRIEFFFLELYFRTKCGNSGRLAADFHLHPSEIPNAFILLHCALASGWGGVSHLSPASTSHNQFRANKRNGGGVIFARYLPGFIFPQKILCFFFWSWEEDENIFVQCKFCFDSPQLPRLTIPEEEEIIGFEITL